MTEQTTTPAVELTTEIAKALAAPFDASWIEKLPKPVKRNDDNKGRCQAESDDPRSGPYYSADGHYCGGWHARSVHLDYVGHAGITMRLNDVVGPGGWTLEPLATTDEGLPLMTRGEFWAKLTILGVTHVDLAANYNSTQEAWGDALRRTAMRFGIGTYLWAKSEFAAELAAHRDPDPREVAAQEAADLIHAGTVTDLDAVVTEARDGGYLNAIVRIGGGEGTLAEYVRQVRPHVQPPKAPETAQNATQEPPAPVPAPEEAQAPEAGPQAPPQGPAIEYARAALEEGDVDALRGLWNMAAEAGLLDVNVLAVVGDDDLAALDLTRNPSVEAGNLPLRGLLLTVNAYVGRHRTAVRDLGEPEPRPAERRTSVDEADPWATDAAAGWQTGDTPPAAGDGA